MIVNCSSERYSGRGGGTRRLHHKHTQWSNKGYTQLYAGADLKEWIHSP